VQAVDVAVPAELLEDVLVEVDGAVHAVLPRTEDGRQVLSHGPRFSILLLYSLGLLDSSIVGAETNTL
jgi:hypothetical protein